MKKHGLYRHVIEGTRFGRLTISKFFDYKYVGKKKEKRELFSCKCDCGNEIVVLKSSLLSGNTQSCGCLAKETVSKITKGKPSPNRLPAGMASFSHLYATYKYNAKNRNYSFELTKDQFKKLTDSNCFYCNKSPNQICNHKTGDGLYKCTPYIYNGVDRKNNSIGYTIENSIPCCGTCNKAKGILSEYEFIEMVKNIYEHRIKK